MSDHDTLRDARLNALLEAVLAQTHGDDPRANELISALIRHLHAFVRETRPTSEGWLTGLDFFVRTGQTCTEHHDELILLSDVLGLTSAVDDVNRIGSADATPSSVQGPLQTPAPARENGAWISEGPERTRAETMVVRGLVTDTDGKPIEGATVDIRQADDAGHYDTQDAPRSPATSAACSPPTPTAPPGSAASSPRAIPCSPTAPAANSVGPWAATPCAPRTSTTGSRRPATGRSRRTCSWPVTCTSTPTPPSR
jgi:hypothetical protein